MMRRFAASWIRTLRRNPDAAAADVAAAAQSLESAGYAVQREGETAMAADPWGTTIRITSDH